MRHIETCSDLLIVQGAQAIPTNKQIFSLLGFLKAHTELWEAAPGLCPLPSLLANLEFSILYQSLYITTCKFTDKRHNVLHDCRFLFDTAKCI